MEIIEFKDYPNTETPMSSHNLNRMQNNIKTELSNIEQEGIIVSPTEPTTNRRKVWLQNVDNNEKIHVLNDNNVYEEFAKKHEDIYSTEEQVVGKWIDGKTLYRKTIVFPNGTNITTQKQFLLQEYGITNVDEIFIAHPSFYTNGNNRVPFPLNDGNKFELQVNKTILLVTITYESIAKSYMLITLEYTKTTD